MVVASRTTVCTAIVIASIASTACGVVLPPADDGPGTSEQSPNEPASTKGAEVDESKPGEGDTAVPVSPGPSPGRTYGVFVTSREYTSAEIGGLTGADQRCTDLAAIGAPVFRGRNWKAWLGAGNTSARSRLGTTPGPWERIDRVIVADSVDHLTNATPLRAPISIDDRGTARFGRVWTGTHADGSVAADTCIEWTKSTGRGLFGVIGVYKPDWTAMRDVPCDGSESSFWEQGGGDGYPPDGDARPPTGRLYCFEID